MTDRLDTIRKRLASGSPFTPHAGDLAWALDEIERLTKKASEAHASLRTVAHEIGVCHCWDFGCEPGPTADIVAAVMALKGYEAEAMEARVARDEDGSALAYARAEITRLDALSRATADDPEDAVPCVPCGRVECECGDARDEMENA